MRTELSKQYKYPAVIDAMIASFVEICERNFVNQKLGILLVGSTARGELVWTEIANLPYIFSDMEFLVVAEDVSRNTIHRFSAEILALQNGRSLGNRFKLDFSVLHWRKLPTLEKRIFIFDCKNSGIELGSAPVRCELPKVTKQNLNFQELNDTLLHRMKAVVNDIPMQFDSDGVETAEFKQSIAKNTLDVTTWLFPYESEHLTSGFKDRMRVWRSRWREMKLSDYLSNAEFEFLEECLEARSSGKSSKSTAFLLRNFLSVYERAIRYCKKMNGLESSVEISSSQASQTLFWEYNPRRRVMEAYKLTTHFEALGTRLLLRNIFCTRKGAQIEFCITLLEALLSILEGRDHQSRIQIRQSHSRLSNFLRVDIDEGASPLHQWYELREQYQKYNKLVI